MAGADKQEGGAVVPRLHQLLPPVHKRLLGTRTAALRPDTEQHQMALGNRGTVGFRQTKAERHLCPHPHFPRLHETVPHRGRQFRLRDRSCPLSDLAR